MCAVVAIIFRTKLFLDSMYRILFQKSGKLLLNCDGGAGCVHTKTKVEPGLSNID